MSRSYKYAIARFADQSARNERLNVGLIVFQKNSLAVRISPSLDKIRAMTSAVDLGLFRESLENLPEIDAFFLGDGLIDEETRAERLREVAPVEISPLGIFYAESEDAYERTILSLLKKLVEPEVGIVRNVRQRSSKLLSSVKAAFSAERVLARKGEDLSSHRIMMNYKLAEGLPADLLLKNGSMHVVQTVDAADEEGSIRKLVSSVAVSALVFERARMEFGESETVSRLVYRASSTLESSITPSLDAAEHQGARLINWESRDDRTRFVVELSSLAEPLAEGSSKSSSIHASVQPKFRLN